MSSKSAGDGCGVLLGLVGILLFKAWVLMLALGMLHHEVHEAIPPLGMLHAAVIVVALRLILK